MKKYQKYYNKILPVILVGLTLIVCYCVKQELTGLEVLVKSVGERRFTEARLSGGFSYGTLELPSSEVDKKTYSNQESFLLSDNKKRGNSDTKEKLLNDAAVTIYGKLDKFPTPIKLHEIGVLNLLGGHYTQAIDYLEKAVTSDKKNSEFLNDLAVAYLERGEQQKRPEDFVEAISLIDEAVSLGNSLIEAKFNQALALEKLYLVSNAQKAWQEYLSLEQNANWKQEAQSHLVALRKEPEINKWSLEKKDLETAVIKGDSAKSKSIIINFPHQARIYTLEELIPEWAKAFQETRREDAAKAIKIANTIGQELLELQGDKEIHDIVNTIISANQNHQQEIILAKAQLDYATGRKFFENYENEKAIKSLDQAIAGFSQTKDKASQAWAIFQRSRCDLIQTNYQSVFKRFDSIRNLVTKESYLYLKARILWAEGLIYGYQHDLSKALEKKQFALASLTQLGDTEGSAKVNLLIMLTLVDIGDREELWSYFYQSSILLSKIPESVLRTGLLVSLSNTIIKVGEIQLADHIYKEVIEEVLKGDNELLKCTSLLEHSKINYQLGKPKEALADLTLAKEHLAKISDPDHKKNTEQAFLFTEANYQINTNPKAAIITYSNVLDSIKSGEQLYTTRIYSSRAKAYLALGDYEKAEADLQAGIKEFESQRSKITDERYRLSFFEDPQTVYEDMIKFQIDKRKRLDLAFNYVEDARSRSLLDSIDGRARAIKLDTRQELKLDGTATPLDLEQVQQGLPASVIMIRYLVTADKLYAWIVTKEKANLVEQNIVEADLERQIARLRKTIIDPTSTPPAIQAATTPVYQAIFEKVKPYLKSLNSGVNPTLIIVPDKALYAVPFASLIDPETKRYLVEDFAIGMSPSATVYLRCLERDRSIAKNTDETVLAVGNPIFLKKHFQGMTYLPGAESEAKAVSEIYPKSTLLLREDATKEAFLKEITKYNVIHYAGHALIDPSSPLFSKLVLAAPEKSPEDYDEALYAHEVYGRQFKQTKLIVLAACRTAGGLRTRGEGMISLARPFLASGVPAVIASLWDANDNASLALFKVFHKERMAGQNSLEALRLAQLDLLKSENPLRNHPRMWALFQVIGGVDLVKPQENKSK